MLTVMAAYAMKDISYKRRSPNSPKSKGFLDSRRRLSEFPEQISSE